MHFEIPSDEANADVNARTTCMDSFLRGHGNSRNTDEYYNIGIFRYISWFSSLVGLGLSLSVFEAKKVKLR